MSNLVKRLGLIVLAPVWLVTGALVGIAQASGEAVDMWKRPDFWDWW